MLPLIVVPISDLPSVNKTPLFEVTSDGKEMTVAFSASSLYAAIEKYRDKLGRKGSFVDYRKVAELMNSGKLDDPNVTIIAPDYDPNDPDSDPNFEYKSPTPEFIMSYAHGII